MNKLTTFITAICVAVLSGCTTYDAYTGEEKTSNTAIGAGIGAGAATLISYIKNKDASSDDRRRRMLQAAGIGALAGGSIGYYMDSQEAELRKQLRSSGVSVVREGNSINLVMPGNITFNTNSGDIKGDFYDVLNSITLVLEEYEQTIIVIAGHTDSTGSESFNQNLSEQRAKSVASYLKSKKVVDARIETIGLGEGNPIADNSSLEGRAKNRRVELTLIPITENDV